MQPILTAENLRFLDILRYPAIAVARGSATFLCGQSGTGKSTLFKLFNATESPSEGTLTYDGRDIAELDTIALRREVLLVSQKVYLFDEPIRANFEQFYTYRGEPCIGEDAMLEALRLCSLEQPLDANCQTLSGGERQRVYLAIHLSMKPRVLMLDEPTSALDVKTARQMLKNLKEYCLGAGMTLLVISHDPALAQLYADQVIELSEGACEL